MKRRPWVLAAVIFSMAFGFSVFVLFRYINRSDWLKDQILSATSSLPGILEINSVELSSSYLKLFECTYISQDSMLTIDVRQINLDLQLSNLVSLHGSPVRLITGVTFIEPEIDVRLDKITTGGQDSSTPIDTSIFRELSFFRQVLIHEGNIAFQLSQNREIMQLDSLEGWVRINAFENVTYHLNTVPFNTAGSRIEVNGTSNLFALINETRIAISNLDLNDIPVRELQPGLDVGGNLAAQIAIRYEDNHLSYDGAVELDNIQFTIPGGPTVRNMRILAELDSSYASIESQCLLENEPLSFSGIFTLLDSISFRADFVAPEVDFGEYLVKFADLDRELKPIGNIRVSGQFVWNQSDGSYEMVGVAEADTLLTTIGPFTGINLDASINSGDSNFFYFNQLTAHWFGLEAIAGGVWNPKNQARITIDVDIGGTCDPSDLPAWTRQLQNKSTIAQIQINQRREIGFTVEGSGRVFDSRNPSLGEIEGRIDGSGYSLQLSLYEPFGRSAFIRMSSETDRPVRFTVREPQILGGWWNPNYTPSDFLHRLHAEAEFTVDHDLIYGNATVNDPITRFNLSTHGSLVVGENDLITGDYSYVLDRNQFLIGNGIIDFSYTDETLVVENLTFKDYFMITGAVDFRNNEILDMSILTENLVLDEVVPGITSLPYGAVGGKIIGRADVSGPFDSPEIIANFDVYDGRYENLRDYWGQLSLETSLDGELFIRRGEFGRAEHSLLVMTGAYSIPDNNLDISIESSGTDADVIATAFSGRHDLMDGRLVFNANVLGELAHPAWNATLTMEDAVIADIEFDSVDIYLEGSTTRRLGPVVYVRRFLLAKEDHYSFTAFGVAPLVRGAGEIQVNAEGELMNLLPQVTSFFYDPEGQGDFAWTFTLVSGQLVASRGRLRVNDGSIRCTDVFPWIDQIELDVEVDSDGNLTINQASGRVGEHGEFEVRNNPGSTANPREYPIILDDYGLNLGVLELRTLSEEGIHFNIPDVMTTPDFARLDLQGKNNDQWFRISRATRSFGRLMTGSDNSIIGNEAFLSIPRDTLSAENYLLCTGAATLNSTVMTYPPYGMVEGQAVNVEELLFFPSLFYNAQWNVDARIGREVYYVREIRGFEEAPFFSAVSGLISQVDLELEVNPTNPQMPLRASGRVADESFRLVGDISSDRGRIDLLDLVFQLEHGELSFDESSILPIASGRAKATVVERTLDYTPTRNIYLTLYVTDPVTGEQIPRGRWGEFVFMLEDDQGSLSQEEVLASLGYLDRDLSEVGGEILVREVTRRWLRPVERSVERWLGLDLVRFNPTMSSFYITNRTEYEYNDLNPDPNESGFNPLHSYYDPYYQASSVSVGKYITRDLFLSYTGKFGRDIDTYSIDVSQGGRVGLLQQWNMEYRIYRISPNLLLEAGWEYDNLETMNNRSIRLKYNFVF